MRKALVGLGALTLASALAACSTDEPKNNVAAEDVNAMMNVDELPPAENGANEAAEAPAAEAPPAAQPAPAKPAPAPEKPKAAEPKAPTPECLPEHRAAGHC